ncbi:aminoglycoside phosphotransferase family protein [Streptococcus ruminantium]|nr:aminoglycoside phosphotransferase family protein [Streptococcus ruminantium]
MPQSRIVSSQPITKGWSTDKKYKVQLQDGRFGLLRIAERSSYERKRAEFSLAKNLSERDLPVARPEAFWLDEQFVYSLFEWLEGEDMAVLPSNLSDRQLYALGCQAGQFLRKLHSLPIDQSQRAWNSFYQAKIDSKLAAYQAARHSYENDQVMLEFVRTHRHLLESRPIAYHHGDFHMGNFLLGLDGQLKVLDFDRHDIGDPWEEFNRLVFTAALSPTFASGQIYAYFNGCIPTEFWSLLPLYLTVNSLGALAWAEKVAPEQVLLMKRQANQILDWYEEFSLRIPKWYR